MSDPPLALRKAIRTRLTASSGVTSLVPASAILSTADRPERFPCILIRDGSAIYGDNYSAFFDQVFADLHIWAANDEDAMKISGAVREALTPEPWSVEGFHTHRLHPVSSRTVPDPNSSKSHTVMSVEAILKKVAA